MGWWGVFVGVKTGNRTKDPVQRATAGSYYQHDIAHWYEVMAEMRLDSLMWCYLSNRYSKPSKSDCTHSLPVWKFTTYRGVANLQVISERILFKLYLWCLYYLKVYIFFLSGVREYDRIPLRQVFLKYDPFEHHTCYFK